MNAKRNIIGLDIGDKRIGVSLADSIGRIAMPLTTLIVDGTEVVKLQTILLEHEIDQLVVGLPRNQAGEQTAQSDKVRQFTEAKLKAFDLPIKYQDESVTSVLAESQLASSKKPYSKADIDARAAALILQDYLEDLNG